MATAIHEWEIHLRHKALLGAGWRIDCRMDTMEVVCFHPDHGRKTFEEAQRIYFDTQKLKPSHPEYDKVAAKLQEKGWRALADKADTWEHDILGSMSKEEAYEVANR